VPSLVRLPAASYVKSVRWLAALKLNVAVTPLVVTLVRFPARS
jgi:hypothetical protein